MSLLTKIFGDPNDREVRKIEKIVDVIESYDSAMQALSDDELRAKTDEFKERIAGGATLDELLPEAFAVCREGAVRSLGMKHFRVQLIGGVVLHQGSIAEMKTGEGKTLVATLPVYLNALAGKGVHVITVNDYLAKRDAEWMGRLYTFLGLSVGCVVHGITPEERRAAYLADVTYGTNNEFGFDYLRDNMVTDRSALMQRDLNYAIIDEVDSILIDEARTPLIISGKGDDSSDMYRKADDFVRGLSGKKVVREKKGPLMAMEDDDDNDFDFIVEEKDKQVALTDRGVRKAEKFFGVENYGDPENMEINHYVQQALKARNTMERDVDYIVKDGEVIIVDEFTGRLMFGRRFSNGLHQAIEAKERVSVRSESKTLATITLQNYFRMYGKLAGMTGTAKTEESEFLEIYNMAVITIPTNLPVKREDLPDSVYTSEDGKFKAIVERIKEIHATGQPILVGTISIEKSERLGSMLDRSGLKGQYNILNAKQHEKEAQIVAEAGRLGKVTIATNMAGRGTDIILGGNPEFEARRELEKREYTQEQIAFAVSLKKPANADEQKLRDEYKAILAEKRAAWEEEHKQVVSLGGLAIIGSERHESRRIDNQLRGRSGRQGDPGCTQFFVSLEDDLMRLFGGERMQSLMGRVGMEEDQALEAGMLSKAIEGAQKKVEGRNFGIRKYVLQYDNVMNRQREIIYGERRKVLFGEDLKDQIMGMKDTLIESMVEAATADSKYPEEWDLATLSRNLRRISPDYRGRKRTEEEIAGLTKESLIEEICGDFTEIYEKKEKELGSDFLRVMERSILLLNVDRQWMDHIDAMDQLKSGIGLRSIGQMDPAAEYAKEGFDMFDQLIGTIQEDTVKNCYGITGETKLIIKKANLGGMQAKKDEFEDKELKAAAASSRKGGSGRSGAPRGGMPGGMPNAPEVPPREKKQETVRRETPKVGRNDPCPCGSGKKYKNCCMKKDMGLVSDPFDGDK